MEGERPTRAILNHDDLIITECIKKSFKTKNTHREEITRRTSKAILLECGHKIYINRWPKGKVPKNKTTCWECWKRQGEI